MFAVILGRVLMSLVYITCAALMSPAGPAVIEVITKSDVPSNHVGMNDTVAY